MAKYKIHISASYCERYKSVTDAWKIHGKPLDQNVWESSFYILKRYFTKTFFTFVSNP